MVFTELRYFLFLEEYRVLEPLLPNGSPNSYYLIGLNIEWKTRFLGEPKGFANILIRELDRLISLLRMTQAPVLPATGDSRRGRTFVLVTPPNSLILFSIERCVGASWVCYTSSPKKQKFGTEGLQNHERHE